jgi:two-component system sensor histidine kinase CpxA
VATASGKAEEIAGLVNELLSFSKAALGASQIRLQPVSVRALAEKAMAREAAQGATFTLEAAPEIRVQAEPELLLRAFSNLLRNAVRYAGPAGPITLSARREGGYVDIAVTDCGPGVPEPDLDRVFEPFYRVDASRDRATGGVGLGLAIVKTCVESCGGTVLCRNRPPAGLEVLIRLSAAQPGEPEPSAATHPGVHAPL